MAVYMDGVLRIIASLPESDVVCIREWLTFDDHTMSDKTAGGCPFGGKHMFRCEVCYTLFEPEWKSRRIHLFSFIAWHCPCNLLTLKKVQNSAKRVVLEWDLFHSK